MTPKPKRVIRTISLAVGLVLLVSFAGPSLRLRLPVAHAEDFDDLQLIVGDVETLKVHNLKRISITDPDVADISNATNSDVLVLAKGPGQTVLFLWDDDGKRSIVVRVVEEDLGLVKTRVLKLMQKLNITNVNVEENKYEGKVVVSGAISKEDRDNLSKMLESFGDKVINLVQEEKIQDLFQIDVQVTEVDESWAKHLGISWGTGSGGSTGGTSSGSSSGSSSDQFSLPYGENLPTFDGSIGDLFKIGDFSRTSAMLASVNALVQEGKGRILSKPRLVVANGKEASFLVGGELPVKSTTLSTTGTSTESTSFKSYGVSMMITPTLKNGKIEVILKVEISDIDSSNSTSTDVAFLTRNAQTQLLLDDGQTIVLAGLIKKSRNTSVTRIPFVSDIPILGLLFRDKRNPTPEVDQELVISLTPTIIKATQKTEKKTTVTMAAKPVYKDKDTGSGDIFASTPSAPEVSTRDVMSGYVEDIQQKISSSVTYPYEAQKKGWEGIVKLTLKILKDGTLSEVTVKESSGYSIFDQDAINTAQMLAPYAPFPQDSDLEELVVTVPIVYSQNGTPQTTAKAFNN